MAKVYVGDLLRKDYAAFDSEGKMVLRLADLASLTRDAEYSGYTASYSVFRVPPKTIKNKLEVDVVIRDESTVCLDGVCFKASFVK